MPFDIILPTYNNLDELKSCLDGLAKQTCNKFTAIICVDGSTDGTVEYLSTATYPFRFIVAEHPDRRNHGRNATRNIALPHIINDYLLLLDTDAVPAPDLLEAHLSLLDNKNCISQGRFVFTNTESNIWARYLSTRGRNKSLPGAEIPYPQFNSGNAAFGSRYFKELGGQDPAMTHYGAGDTEFAIRLFDRFHPSFINNTDAVASSEMTQDLDAGLVKMKELGRYNLHYLYEKHPAHRGLYGMSLMNKYAALFSIASNPFVLRIARHMATSGYPPVVRLFFIRCLVIAYTFQGFSLR